MRWNLRLVASPGLVSSAPGSIIESLQFSGYVDER